MAVPVEAMKSLGAFEGRLGHETSTYNVMDVKKKS